MEKISNFNLSSVKVQNVIYAKTSPQDYEMSRTYIVESGNDYIVLEGYHCSCYGFNDIAWEAIKYTDDEMKKICKFKDEDWKIFMKIYLG